MRKINWFGIAGGASTLVTVLVSYFYPWWKLAIGNNIFVINLSPLRTNVNLLDTSLTIPLLWALNTALALLMVLSGTLMLVYSLIPSKPYSKDLLGFAYRKPLYLVIIFAVGLLAASLLFQIVLGVGVPLMGTSTIMLPSSLTMGLASVGAVVSGSFLLPFWLAIASAVLCIAARFYHPTICKAPKPSYATTPPPTP